MGSIPGILVVDDGTSSGVAEAFQKCRIQTRYANVPLPTQDEGAVIVEVKQQEVALTEYQILVQNYVGTQSHRSPGVLIDYT